MSDTLHDIHYDIDPANLVVNGKSIIDNNELKIMALNNITEMFRTSFKRDLDKIYILNHTNGKSDDIRERLADAIGKQKTDTQFAEGTLLKTCKKVKTLDDNQDKIIQEFVKNATVLTAGKSLGTAFKLLDKIKFKVATEYVEVLWGNIIRACETEKPIFQHFIYHTGLQLSAKCCRLGVCYGANTDTLTKMAEEVGIGL